MNPYLQGRGSRSRIGAAVLIVLIAVIAAIGRMSSPPAPRSSASHPAPDELVATFSIVAFDRQTGDLGVAVQSKFFGVGSVVPFAAAGVGAVATQSLANTTYGPRGLELLRQGVAPAEALDRLLADDPQRDLRQVGIVDAAGNVASFTGDGCLAWAGHRSGDGYSVQGNILAGAEVIDAMAATFESTDGDLASRLVAALAAGQAAGGDVRGRQSAALLVVREAAGYGGYDDRFIDLRVEDHETPIVELQRLLDIARSRILAERAEEALQAAADAAGTERQALVDGAIDQLTIATGLDPGNGWHWMSLAAAQLLVGDTEAATRAGVRALRADPWIKTGVLRGLGSLEVVERLLEQEVFRSAWEKIPVRYRSP